jgi:hypothetical protein
MAAAMHSATRRSQKFRSAARQLVIAITCVEIATLPRPGEAYNEDGHFYSVLAAVGHRAAVLDADERREALVTALVPRRAAEPEIKLPNL